MVLLKLLDKKRMGSAIAIIFGLGLSYVGGENNWRGAKGIADIGVFAGVGTLGGGMFRDYAIISTALGVKLKDLKKTGFLGGVLSLFVGIFSSFL